MEDNKQIYNRCDGEPKWVAETLSKYGIFQIDDGGLNNWRHTNGADTCAFSGEIKGYWGVSVYISTDKHNNIDQFGSENRITTFFCAERLDEHMKLIDAEKSKQSKP